MRISDWSSDVCSSDLAGADAEGECPERTVGGGVAVAADDGHAGLGQAELGTDHVDDAAMCAVVVEQLDAVSCAVAAQGSDLCLGVCADVRQAAIGLRRQGRSGMVERGRGQVGTPGAQAARVELGESLRRGDLVDQVQVDVEDRKSTRLNSSN